MKESLKPSPKASIGIALVGSGVFLVFLAMIGWANSANLPESGSRVARYCKTIPHFVATSVKVCAK